MIIWPCFISGAAPYERNRSVYPHHRHPNGEIDLIMPLEPGAQGAIEFTKS
jgi:hypothetical protein